MAEHRVIGAFEFKGEPHPRYDKPNYYFNLGPKDDVVNIPEDQAKISHDVYEARNILMLLKSTWGVRRILERTPDTKQAPPDEDRAWNMADEFIIRIKQAAGAGCVRDNVHVSLAAKALEQIREDIVRRVAKPIIYRYLAVLALCAAVVVAVAALLAGWADAHKFTNYSYVVIGSMLGAWLSAAATRQQVTFAGLQNFVDVVYDPPIRILFVVVFAIVLTLILQTGLIKIDIKGLDIANIDNVPWALVLGAVIGISEQALSVKVIDRVRQIIKLR
jgi:hypothetical protein